MRYLENRNHDLFSDMFDDMFRAPVMNNNTLMKTDIHEKDGKYILDRDKLDLVSGTFHSVASSFLREYSQEIGYNRNFKIRTSWRSKYGFNKNA